MEMKRHGRLLPPSSGYPNLRSVGLVRAGGPKQTRAWKGSPCSLPRFVLPPTTARRSSMGKGHTAVGCRSSACIGGCGPGRQGRTAQVVLQDVNGTAQARLLHWARSLRGLRGVQRPEMGSGRWWRRDRLKHRAADGAARADVALAWSPTRCTEAQAMRRPF